LSKRREKDTPERGGGRIRNYLIGFKRTPDEMKESNPLAFRKIEAGIGELSEGSDNKKLWGN